MAKNTLLVNAMQSYTISPPKFHIKPGLFLYTSLKNGTIATTILKFFALSKEKVLPFYCSNSKAEMVLLIVCSVGHSDIVQDVFPQCFRF